MAKHPTTKYAEDVVKGKIPACKWVRLAGQRHLNDLETGKKRGIIFDTKAANHVFEFFETFLVFYEGEFDGKPFILQPFQKFILGNLFGWKTKDKVRRFRTAYIEMGKGNGKTPIAGGIGLYGLLFDDEPGAEIYSAATTREQAGILFRDARAFADGSPDIKEMLQVDRHNIAYMATNSYFRPISSEHRGLDGKRPHIALIDEIHEHPNGMVVDKIRAGTKGRRQALIVEITNSGYDRQSICFQHHEYTEKILEGIFENDSWFGYITGLDVCDRCLSEGKTIPQDGCPDCDSWRDEKTWIKANPCLGVSIPAKYIREQVAEAVEMPTKENIVKRLNFNIWTEGITKWITSDRWNACADPTLKMEDFIGQPCYAAFDLANKIDISAAIFLFNTDMGFVVFGKYYLPEDTIKESNNDQYQVWAREKLITVTPGAMTDYYYIEQDFKEINKKHPITELAFDPHEATYLVNNMMTWLKEGTCIEITQGPAHMSEPMKELEARVYSQKIWHNGDPVLAWMLSCVVLKEARSGGPVKYYYPTKTSKDNKIDGVIAMVMAVGRGMLKCGPVDSVYENKTPEEISQSMAF